MTTSPITSISDELLAELEAAANGAKGWQLGHAFQVVEEGYLPDEWDWCVGAIDESGNEYPVLLVNTAQWDQQQDAASVARYYAAANRDTILALLAERAGRMRQIDTLTEWYANALNENAECSAVLPGSYYMDPPDGGDVPVPEQLRRMAKDAERYRWLRDKAVDADGVYPMVSLTDDCGDQVSNWLFGQAVDKAIDAAMQEAKP